MSGRQNGEGKGGGHWWQVADFNSLQKINSLRLSKFFSSKLLFLKPDVLLLEDHPCRCQLFVHIHALKALSFLSINISHGAQWENSLKR